LGDFFGFRALVTPALIKALYAVGAVMVTLGSIPVGMAAASSAGDDGAGFLAGLAYFVIANLVWRVCCELLIIIFSIHDRLVELTDAIPSGNRASGSAEAEASTSYSAELEEATLAVMPEPNRERFLHRQESRANSASESAEDHYERWAKSRDPNDWLSFMDCLRAGIQFLPRGPEAPAVLGGLYPDAAGQPDFDEFRQILARP
jgi:hypothetical protein